MLGKEQYSTEEYTILIYYETNIFIDEIILKYFNLFFIDLNYFYVLQCNFFRIYIFFAESKTILKTQLASLQISS